MSVVVAERIAAPAWRAQHADRRHVWRRLSFEREHPEARSPQQLQQRVVGEVMGVVEIVERELERAWPMPGPEVRDLNIDQAVRKPAQVAQQSEGLRQVLHHVRGLEQSGSVP